MIKADIKVVEDSTGRAIKDVLKTMSRAESSALRRAANVMKKNIRDKAKGTGVAMMKRSEKYSDRLIDAIRSSKVRDGGITVHIMGTRKSGSGTFRTRFFEGGTQIRYQTSRNGKPLAKKKSIGRIKETPFFSRAISGSDQRILSVMDEQLTKYIEKAWNNA